MATSPTLYPFTNDQGDTFDTLGPDEVPTGDTIELDGHRYTVDHVEGGDDGADHVDVHTTSGAVFSVPADDSLTVVTRRGIPAPATEPDRRVAGTVVHHWSGVTLPAAATLVRRADLRPGDIVQSSHGYRLHITSATVQGETSALRGTLHGPTGDERTERCDADTLIPVYVRGPEPSPAPAETITITLTREQAQHLGALVDHAGRWHSEWGEYIRPDAVLNKDITEQEAEETATEHEEAAALGIELLRQTHAATTEPPTTPAAGATPTVWVVYCETHRDYLVRASSNGTVWRADRADATEYATKPKAREAARAATWRDHSPVAWASTPAAPTDARL